MSSQECAAPSHEAPAGTPTSQAKPAFDQLPLATCPLSLEERARWINVLDPLLKYAGSPGDWGYGSKLGILTKHLLQVRAELVSEGGAA